MKFGSEIDFADIFTSGLLGLVLNVLVFMTALWLGLMIGGAAMAAADLVEGGSLDLDWLAGPFRSSRSATFFWMLFGVLGLAGSYFKFSRLDSGGGILWGFLNGAIGALCLWFQLSRHSVDVLPKCAAWAVWAISLGMIGTALWFLRQWQMNRWATELIALETENAIHRAEMEQEGDEEEDSGP